MTELLVDEEWELLQLLAKRASGKIFDPHTWHLYVHDEENQMETWTCGICRVEMYRHDRRMSLNETISDIDRTIALHGRQHLKDSGLLPFL